MDGSPGRTLPDELGIAHFVEKLGASFKSQDH